MGVTQRKRSVATCNSASRRGNSYEEAMRASPFVKSLQSPISNLFQKTDINFQFMIVLNVDAMRKVYETAP